MKTQITALLFLVSVSCFGQYARKEKPQKINLHLEMSDRMQITSGVLVMASVATFATGLLFTKGDTQKALYIISGDCLFFSGAFQIASVSYKKRERVNKK